MKISHNLYYFFLAIFFCTTISSCSATNTEDSTTNRQESLGPSARQIELMQKVMSPDGELTPEIHAEYWSDFRKLNDVDADYLAARFKKSMPLFQRYQKALWESARLSLRASKVIHSPEFESISLELKRAYPDNDDTSEAKANSFLEAAASGKPLKKGNVEIYITEEQIDATLVGIDKSIERLINLLDRNWKP